MEAALSIPFDLKKIELLSSSLNEPDKPIPDNMVFQYEIDIQHQLLKEHASIAVLVEIHIRDIKRESTFGTVCTRCVYEVLELSHFVKDEKNKETFLEQLYTTLNSVSLSTTRGIMFSLFRGTFLHNALLPIVASNAFTKS
jgi:hypothetical protein